jgi:hypothetical protein
MINTVRGDEAVLTFHIQTVDSRVQEVSEFVLARPFMRTNNLAVN